MISGNKQKVLSKIYEYLEMKEKRGLTKGTIYNYLSLLGKLLKFETIDKITVEELNKLIYGLEFTEKKGKRDGLARRFYFMIVCKNFFQFLGRNDLVDWLNAVGLPKYKQGSPKPVAKEIIETVLNFESIPEEELSNEDKENLRFAVLFMVNTGLRANEFLNLKIGDIEGNYIKVKSKGEIEKEDLILNDTAKALLQNHLSNIDLTNDENKQLYVFNLSNEKFSYWSFWYMFKTILSFCPHQLRHTFCYQLEKLGLTPTEIQTMARHKDFDTTLKYINPEKKKIENEYRDKVKNVI